MNIAQALKQKNRLAGELVRQQQILSRENSRRSDSVSVIDREELWNNIVRISEELGILKGKITKANINIYPTLERMSELKSRISYITGLSVREGDEVTFFGRDQERLVYTWNSYITQAKADDMISSIQSQIDLMQDTVDSYNAVTMID